MAWRLISGAEECPHSCESSQRAEALKVRASAVTTKPRSMRKLKPIDHACLNHFWILHDIGDQMRHQLCTHSSYSGLHECSKCFFEFLHWKSRKSSFVNAQTTSEPQITQISVSKDYSQHGQWNETLTFHSFKLFWASRMLKELFWDAALKIMKIPPLSMLKPLLNLNSRKLVFLKILHNIGDEMRP